MSDDTRHLVVYKAPPGALDRALRSQQPSPWRGRLGLAAAVLIGLGLGRWTAPEAVTTTDEVVQVVSDTERVPVRLVIHAPDAATAAVAGSFNDWDFSQLPMERSPEGTFHATLLLDRGSHEYMFVLDGHTWVTDPAADVTRDDGFGNANAVLEI